MDILLLVKTPPPITGATIVNKYVLESRLLRSNAKIKAIEISYAKTPSEFGKLRLAKMKTVVVTFYRLLKEILFCRPDFVYFQISPLGAPFIRDACYVALIKMLGVKILYHLHGKGIRSISQSPILKHIYKFVFNNAYVIHLSEMLLCDIESVYRGNPYVVNNGVPISIFQRSQRSNQLLVLTFLSNLKISKGLLDFVEALQILKRMDVEFKVNIVGGDGDINSKQLFWQVTQRNLTGNVLFIGPKYGKEKEVILANTDIFVFPTYSDCFPLVLLEAMQFGIPIISTREGAIPEIVEDGVTGFLVEKKSPEEIADKVSLLARDSALRKKMGAAAKRKFLKEYTLEIFEGNMLEVFKAVNKAIG